MQKVKRLADYGPDLHRQMWYWAIFDWANSPFFAIIVTFVFSTYFTHSIASSDVSGASLLGVADAVAGLATAALAIILGPVADKTGNHKRWLGLFVIINALASVALFWAYPGSSHVWWALIWFSIGFCAGEVMNVFYNAMLRTCFPVEVAGRLSGIGWGLGYFGGLVCLGLVLLLLHFSDDIFVGVDASSFIPRLSGPLVALWICVFSIPIFFGVKDADANKKLQGHSFSWRQFPGLWHDLLRYPQAGLFLIARLLYIDGVNTMLVFAGVYSVSTFKATLDDVLLFGVSANLLAGIGSFIFTKVEQAFGPRNTIQLTLVVLIISAACMLSVGTFKWFWIIGMVFSLVLGPVQACSRSLFCVLVPKRIAAEMFGLYAFAGRFTTFLGPMILAAVTTMTGSLAWGMSTAVAMNILGFIVLLWVREPAVAAT